MKKLFILALLAATAGTGHAQGIKAGTVSLGGSIGYYRSSNNRSSTYNNGNTTSPSTTTYYDELVSSQFNFSPAVGYFVADNLAIGLSLGYNAYRTTISTTTPGVKLPDLDPTINLRAGVYVQYYKMLNEQFGILGTVGGGYQSTRSYVYANNSTTIVDSKGSGYYAALTPGIIFFPIPKLGISASIGSLAYNRMSFDYPVSPGNAAPSGYENTFSTFGTSFGLDQLQFGGTYYFGR